MAAWCQECKEDGSRSYRGLRAAAPISSVDAAARNRRLQNFNCDTAAILYLFHLLTLWYTLSIFPFSRQAPFATCVRGVRPEINIVLRLFEGDRARTPRCCITPKVSPVRIFASSYPSRHANRQYQSNTIPRIPPYSLHLPPQAAARNSPKVHTPLALHPRVPGLPAWRQRPSPRRPTPQPSAYDLCIGRCCGSQVNSQTIISGHMPAGGRGMLFMNITMSKTRGGYRNSCRRA